MGTLTETEIFECLSINLRLASETCIRLANSPLKGSLYKQLRDYLSLIEGSSRQAAAWRADSRWYDIANHAAQAHKLSGDWLRKYALNQDYLKKMLLKLAEFLAFSYVLSQSLKSKKTGILGPILPEGMDKSSLKQKNAQMRISNGGIIIPNCVSI